MELNDQFLAQMREATQLLQTSGPAEATAAIQRALQVLTRGLRRGYGKYATEAEPPWVAASKLVANWKGTPCTTRGS